MLTKISNAKCPNCGAAATQTIIEERCSKLPQNHSSEFENNLFYCIYPNKLENYKYNNINDDPCINCQYNVISYIDGTFQKIKKTSYNSWIEIHKCSYCKKNFEVY